MVSGSDPRRLEGTWLVTGKFVDPPSDATFKVLFTFMPGSTEDQGTLIDTNEFQFTPNPICTPDQGVWQRTGEGAFIATHYNFCFDQLSDPPGNPAGPTRIRDTITIDPDGRKLEMRQYIQGFDVDGNEVFTGTVLGRGTRIKAQAPPPQ